MRTLVSLDIETTGLDPTLDAIIEIGAVRFRGGRIEDEWSTLVNPGVPLPTFIVELTGITDAMLAGAPRLQEVLPDLEEFVGDAPILGHNVQFDLGFLATKGLFQLNEPVDTFDLASVMLPDSGRYNLFSLASSLGVPLRESHRALEDAHTTRQVFLQLYERVLELPGPILEEIVRLGEEVEWGAGWVFSEAYDERIEAGTHETGSIFSWPDPITDLPPPLEPSPTTRPLDVEMLAADLEPQGRIANYFENYEYRPQQVTMARAVALAFSEGDHLLVEAGTGTGKSMAYLLPAFEWADLNGRRVVISTNTLNLQDQLIHKDIPDLSLALKRDLRAAVLKGRGNYLCPRRFDAMRRIGARSADEMRVIAKLLVWLSQGGDGDRTQLNLPMTEAAVWSRLSADDEDCTLENCASIAGGVCPYYQARLAAERAAVIIVNHALLLADISTGNRVIPEYEYLIVDEAHHLESATTNGLQFRVSESRVLRTLKDIGDRPNGLLWQVIRIARAELPAEQVSSVQNAVESTSDDIQDCVQRMQIMFGKLHEFLEDAREGGPIGPYGQQSRLMPSTRTLPQWEGVEAAWDELRVQLAAVVETLRTLSEDLQDLVESGVESAENLAVAIRIAHRSMAEVFEQLDQMIFEPDPGQIYWLELTSDGSRLSLHAAPLEIGPLVERHLWHEKESVIMTSATLTTAGEFDYIRQRLNADDAEELALGSPFDYESSTLVYLPQDIPEPTDRNNYQRLLESALIELFKTTGGRGLVLFTSISHMRQTARAISDPLARENILTFDQSTGASRHMLLESFRSTDRAVLLGTRSFWEGIDVPGPALSILVIVRLPFDVPSDPIFAARSETYDSPFGQYSVPEAILRFRQGFGRLIRTRSDRGVFVIMDKRVITKTYGRSFLDSLPRCTVQPGNLYDLPKTTARWLNL